ncbi:C40 family peptidase [Nocardioides ferulae]|uniref:C40 family peptidase n=1 Tax=Nocardioides ferulae TaxID=2340821 RepID=UPI000EB21711|nr:NlpC/P60 family protein [Nocardioides ferulae]
MTQTRPTGALRRARTTALPALAGLLAATVLAAAPPAQAAELKTSERERAARPSAPRLGTNGRVLRVARAQAGDPYRYGAAGPHAFDCSGFTRFVYRRAAGEALPHSSSAQVGRTKRISRGSARPGDLVFFHDGGGVYHVAIYAGRGRVWHSPRPGERVHRAPIWTRSVFFGRVR